MNQPKPKRGAKFNNTETTQLLYLERIKSETIYFMCDGPNRLTDNYFDVEVGKLTPYKKPGTGIIKKAPVKTSEQKDSDTALNIFFDEMSLNMPFHCQECNKPLYAYTKFAKRCVSAHVLPKTEEGGFPELATHPDNLFYLGGVLLGICDCHDQWDRKGVDHRKTMKIYPLALEKFEKMKHLLTRPQYVKACDYLGIDWQ